MSNPTIYEHKALRSHRSIRVIILKGTSGGFFKRAPQDGSLEVELEEVSLGTAPSYEALSYTWDGQVPDRSIKCHGKLLKITKNVEIALFRLRTPSKRRLWIDSICIDQTSVGEKSSQIPLMGEIYGKAKRVLVWLGEGTKASDRGFRYLQEVSAVVRPFATSMANPWLPPALEQQILTLKATFQEENKQMYDREGTAASNMLHDIFQRKWFTRMWTFQELVLGFNASMLCGKSELSWPDFMCAVTYLARIEQLNANFVPNQSVFFSQLSIYQQLRAVIHPQLALIPGAQDKRIFKIITSASRLSSWDPRDKLYALYGYFTILGIRNLPPVDYSLPVARVYSEFTKAAILHDQSLDLLYHLGSKRTVKGLPSWTPDWSTPPEQLNKSHKRFSASKTSPLRFSFGENNKLQTWGRIIDTIKERPNSNIPPRAAPESAVFPHPHPDLYLPNIIQRIRAWQEWIFLAAHHQTHPTSETWPQFLLRTILRDECNGSLPQHTLRTEVLEEFLLWCNMIMSHHPYNDNREEAIKEVDEAVDFALQRPATWAVYFKGDIDPLPVINTPEWRIMIAVNYAGTQAIHQRIFERTRGATFFITQNGYTGSGSDLLQAGDQVVLISGMSLPMIVRSQEVGGSRLVAPAYLHGIMNGEKWPENEDEELACFIFK